MIKLHLGCGKRDFGKEWIHIDGGEFPHLSYHDIFNLPFSFNSVDLIYASHVLEYLDIYEDSIALEKWYNVLKPGGTLRLAVPDFKVMSDLYLNHGYSLNNFLGPLYGRMKMNENYIYHKRVYDFETLKEKLISSGFREINKYDWRNTDHAQFDDCSQAYLPHMDKENGVLISLNVEAIK